MFIKSSRRLSEVGSVLKFGQCLTFQLMISLQDTYFYILYISLQEIQGDHSWTQRSFSSIVKVPSQKLNSSMKIFSHSAPLQKCDITQLMKISSILLNVTSPTSEFLCEIIKTNLKISSIQLMTFRYDNLKKATEKIID